MTQNPCYKNGTDCHRRYVGCKAECEEWHEWLAKHEQELEQMRSKKNENHEYYEYSAKVIDKQDRHKTKKRRGQW